MTPAKNKKAAFARRPSKKQISIGENIVAFPPRAFKSRTCCGGPFSLGHECFNFFAIRERVERYRAALAGKRDR